MATPVSMVNATIAWGPRMAFVPRVRDSKVFWSFGSHRNGHSKCTSIPGPGHMLKTGKQRKYGAGIYDFLRDGKYNKTEL